MADIELVVKIPEEKYDRLMKQMQLDRNFSECKITPLPKGHGRLIDADKYLKSVCTYKETGCGSCKLQTTCPVDAPTIIEADKEIQNGFSSICKY